MSEDSDAKPTRRQVLRAIPDDRAPSATAYSITRRTPAETPALGVVMIDDTVEISVDGRSLRLSRANARRLLAQLLEKLG